VNGQSAITPSGGRVSLLNQSRRMCDPHDSATASANADLFVSIHVTAPAIAAAPMLWLTPR
jgi:hypothetical protein